MWSLAVGPARTLEVVADGICQAGFFIAAVGGRSTIAAASFASFFYRFTNGLT